MAGVENTCDCHAIYNERGHIKQRAGKERILGSKGQFCAAFYHVHEWYYRQEKQYREHFCLDEDNCIIAQEAKEHIKKFVDYANKFVEDANKFVENANKFVEDAKKLAVDANKLAEDANKLAEDAKELAKDAKELAKDAKELAKDAKELAKDANKLAEDAKELAKKQKICADEAYEFITKAHKFIEKAMQFDEKAKLFKKKPKNAANKKRAAKLPEQLAEKAEQLDEKAEDAIYAWCVEPEAVVAVVNFEKIDGRILYEARYTNCRKKKMHAEDFLKEDIGKGVLAEIVRDNPNGTITMYLTLQPCNKSTGETDNTNPDQSCCDILKKIVREILRNNGRNIKLCIKATHMNLRLTEQDDTLRQNAERGIKQLMRIEGVNVSGMTRQDWDYLFSMTKYIPPRRDLDREVQDIFERIHRINLP
jgi:hypothetical protein